MKGRFTSCLSPSTPYFVILNHSSLLKLTSCSVMVKRTGGRNEVPLTGPRNRSSSVFTLSSRLVYLLKQKTRLHLLYCVSSYKTLVQLLPSCLLLEDDTHSMTRSVSPDVLPILPQVLTQTHSPPLSQQLLVFFLRLHFIIHVPISSFLSPYPLSYHRFLLVSLIYCHLAVRNQNRRIILVEYLKIFYGYWSGLGSLQFRLKGLHPRSVTIKKFRRVH